MTNIFLLLITLIWVIGTCVRIYRQARFYQIEEYMSARYLRWLFAARDRYLPDRPTAAGVLGVVLGAILSEGGALLPAIIAIIAALIAVYPPDEGEIKKPFRATARAKRLLGAAFTVAALIALLGIFVLGGRNLGAISPALMGAFGLALFLIAPLLLVIGSLLMTPVEAAFRRMFVNRARRTLQAVNPVVIGITGSYGKTSTKTYLAHILNGRFHAHPTPKSYNTLMGVCLAINNDLANDHRIDYFICEMGAYVPGEIQQICDLTHPSISLVVEVGPQHLERFGTLEAIATAKYEIIKALPPDGVGVFNYDNPHIRAMVERGYPQTRLTVSRDPASGARFIASAISESLDGLTFTVTDTQTGDEEVFAAPLLGQHNVTNILLATAVAVNARHVAARSRAARADAPARRKPPRAADHHQRHHHHQRRLQRQPGRRDWRAARAVAASDRQTAADHAGDGRTRRPDGSGESQTGRTGRAARDRRDFGRPAHYPHQGRFVSCRIRAGSAANGRHAGRVGGMVSATSARRRHGAVPQRPA